MILNALKMMPEDERKTIWLFSGQGSQYYSMAREWYAGEPAFREAFDACDRWAREIAARPLAEIVYGPREDRFAPFDRLLDSHLALFAVQWATASLLRSRGVRCDALGGYSLGEIVAATVAGAIRPQDAFELICTHARQAEATLPPGRMSAIMKAGGEPWFEEGEGVWIAARNFDGHFVITGSPQAVLQREQEAEARGFAVHSLPVRYAFHSPESRALEPVFKDALKRFQWKQPNLPLWSAATGWKTGDWDPYELYRGIGGAIDFARQLQHLEAEGPWDYLDAGPSGTSATFVKYNLLPDSESRPYVICSPFGNESEKLADLLVPTR